MVIAYSKYHPIKGKAIWMSACSCSNNRFYNIWKNSDPVSTTGLNRFFIPTWDSSKINRYGYYEQ